jgi:excinuclease ABC subunit C
LPDASFFSQLPSTPGVYAFEDEAGQFLYIGKSIHIKNRIKQHWKSAAEGEKQALFIPLTKKLRYYPVQSDLESLLLEARLIRLYAPLYNAISKDDKSPLYIQVTKDAFPKVLLKRKSDLKKTDTAYGPFTSSATTGLLLKVARRIFHFCSSPPKNGKPGRACFYYHLGMCSGACVGKVDQKQYQKTISLLKRFLNGQTSYVTSELYKSINRSSRLLHFEEAADYKNQLNALLIAKTNIRLFGGFIEGTPRTDKQLKRLVEVLAPHGINIKPDRIECYDMATMQQKDTVGSMVVLNLGIPDKSQYRKFKVQSLEGGDPHNMAEVLRRRFRHPEWPLPDLVILDGGKTQLSIAGSQIPVGIPYVSLAKKEETIIIPKGDTYFELSLQKDDPALQLFQIIRDEAHRFATTYHKKIRDKRSFS